MPQALEAALKFFDSSWVIPVLVIAGAAWFTYSKWKTAEGVKKLAREMGISFSTGADELLGFLRRELFADAAVQDQVLRAMELGGHVTIDDTGVRVETGMGFKDPERIRSTLNVLCATAACLRTRSAR